MVDREEVGERGLRVRVMPQNGFAVAWRPTRDITSRVGAVNGVVPRVSKSLERLLHLRIHAQELPRLRVVVAPDEVDDARQVGVRAREAERRVAAQTTRRLRIAPGVVVNRATERPGGSYGSTHRPQTIGHEVDDRPSRQVDLFCGRPAAGEDVRVGRVHEQVRNCRDRVPDEVLCDLRAPAGR